MRHLLKSPRVYGSANAVARIARLFVAAVFVSRALMHAGEPTSMVLLLLAAAAFIVTPAAYEAVLVRRSHRPRD